MQATRGTPLTPGGSAAPADQVVDPVPRPASGPAARALWLLSGVAAAVVVLDQVAKALVVANLSDRPGVRLLGGWLVLTETRNPGAAFSIGAGATVLFTLIAVGVVVAIVRTARRLHSRWWALALGLLLGGAAGNLVDRLVRAPGPLRGHVVDWIQLPHWPVFNLADAAIVVGGCLAVLLAIAGTPLGGQPAAPADRAAAAGPPVTGDQAGDVYPAPGGTEVGSPERAADPAAGSADRRSGPGR